jgi:molybdopterin synthase catalytic subunit
MTSAIDQSALLVRVVADEEQISMSALTDFVRIDETGAITTFEGVVRGTENGEPVTGLAYEHHPQMAQKELERVVHAALRRFDVQRIACVHRVGVVPSRESSVAIAVGSRHRAAAFDACEFVIDELKVSVPIWKQVLQDGSTSREP